MSQATKSNNQLNALFSDAELINAFGKNGLGKFHYVVSFEHNYREEFSIGYVWADNKPEATKLAREYGIRFLNCSVITVDREL